MFRTVDNVMVPPADCGKIIEFHVVRIIMTDVSESIKLQARKAESLDLPRNTFWTFRRQHCWQRLRRMPGFPLFFADATPEARPADDAASPQLEARRVFGNNVEGAFEGQTGSAQGAFVEEATD